jgi:hypothetical protein
VTCNSGHNNNDSRCEFVENKAASPVNKENDETTEKEEEHGDTDRQRRQPLRICKRATRLTSQQRQFEMAGKEDDHGDTDNDDSRTEVVVEELPDLPQHGVTDVTAKKAQPDCEGETQSEPSKDLVFIRMFTDESGQSTFYPNQETVCVRITEYEDVSGLRLVIRQGFADPRTYHCSSHVGCMFKA